MSKMSPSFFTSRNCKQCPIELTVKPLWANGKEGYFLSAYGTKIKLNHGISHRTPGMQCHNGKRGQNHPQMTHFGNQHAHRIMFATYADEPCPIYFDSKGQPYKGIVHHVIENPYDIRMDNLMGWLTFQQHFIADKRRRALEQTLPNMYIFQTSYIKMLEDPRITTDKKFKKKLDEFREKYQS